MREMEMSAKSVEDAVLEACAALGVDRDDENVSYEILEMPARKFFKTIPAKVKVTVAEPGDDAVAAAPAETQAAPAEAAEAAPAAAPAAVETAAPAETAAPIKPAKKSNPLNDPEVEINLAEDERLQAAIDYLTPIFNLMGAEGVTFTAFKKGEATILRVAGEHMGVLIGRRGETMESLSYLASLVVNRMEGPYVKLGIDVGGYRGKREGDLSALAQRLAERVAKTGYCYEMEPMNPYERHIIHAAVADIEGVRSESKGEGKDRFVVIYSTDPNASNLPDRECKRNRAPRSGGFKGGHGRNDRGGHGFKGGHGGAPRSGGYKGSRSGFGGHGNYEDRPRREYTPRPSGVPEREFANTPRDESVQPQAPAREESRRIRDGEDMDLNLFGKIEL